MTGWRESDFLNMHMENDRSRQYKRLAITRTADIYDVK